MKETLISAAVVLALTGVIGYHKIYANSRTTVQELWRKQEEARQTQEARRHLASSLELIKGYQKRLSPEPETNWLLQQVNRVAEGADVLLSSISPQTPQEWQGLTRISVNLDCVLSYHQLGEFLSRLEGDEAFIRVDGLIISAREDKEDTAKVNISVSTFYSPAVVVN